MGLAYEHGATYFSVSGGDPREHGAVRGRGLVHPAARQARRQPGRARRSSSAASAWSSRSRTSSRSPRTACTATRPLPDGTRLKEQGLGGGLVIYAGGNKWGLTVDVYWGTRTPPGGRAHNFFLFLLALLRRDPDGPDRAARDRGRCTPTGLMPKLEDGRPRGRRAQVLQVAQARPADGAARDARTRRSWKPTKDAWAFGLGLGVSITGCGSVFKLKAFGAGFDSPDRRRPDRRRRVRACSTPKKPLALGVFEYDFRSRRLRADDPARRHARTTSSTTSRRSSTSGSAAPSRSATSRAWSRSAGSATPTPGSAASSSSTLSELFALKAPAGAVLRVAGGRARRRRLRRLSVSVVGAMRASSGSRAGARSRCCCASCSPGRTTSSPGCGSSSASR